MEKKLINKPEKRNTKDTEGERLEEMAHNANEEEKKYYEQFSFSEKEFLLNLNEGEKNYE